MTNILYVIMPAYNETENIEQVVAQWYPIVESHNEEGKSRLVVVNDGSKDDTYDKLQKLSENRPLLQPLTKENGGHGSTVLYGYRYAVSNGADYIFQTDSDGQTDPKEFEQFWRLRTQYDAILGNRQASREDGNSRKFVENTLRFIIRTIFHVSVPDANAPFRLMKTSLVQKYISKLPVNYALPNVMLTTYFVYFKENIRFVQVSFKQRQGGENSINIRKIIKIGIQSLNEFKELKKHIND